MERVGRPGALMELVARMLAHLVDRVRMNRIRQEAQRWIKRRKAYAPLVIAPGNVYLALSRSGIRMHSNPRAWAPYEISRWRALHGDDAAGPIDRAMIWTRALPGESLTTLLDRERTSALAREALRAGGAELRRAHATSIDGEPFSHGDLHLSNLLYADGRARLIDFETPHERTLSAGARHADDLYVLLLDLVAKGHGDLAPALVEGYGPLPALLRERLTLEHALLPRSLQILRSGFLPRPALQAALENLREMSTFQSG
jgi:hypothetical protein